MNRAFLHLIWKDARSNTSFAIALILGALLAQFTIIITTTIATYSPGILEQVIIFVGALMPGIYAYAAGPLLVGGEEENGTMTWLAGLPISWLTVPLSKLVVSLASYIAITLVSYAITRLSWYSSNVHLDARYDVGFQTVVHWWFYGCFVWMSGFFWAYLIRSPVWSLLAVGPWWLFFHVTMTDRIFLFWFPNESVLKFDYLAFVIVLFAFAVLTLLTFALARLRIIRPWFALNLPAAASVSLDAYSPPKSVNLSRPSQWWALLWQEWRQFRWIGFAVLAVTCAPLVLNVLGYHRTSDLIIVIVALGGASILGTAAFLGDAIKTKCLFIGERGLSVTKFWGSRLAVSAVFLVFLEAILFISQSVDRGMPRFDQLFIILGEIFIFLSLVWALGVVSPMLVKRPLLSFFLPVLVLMFAAIPFTYYYRVYEDYLWTVGIAAVIVLVASRHLCERWVTRQLDIGYYGRFIGYAALALIAPVASVMAIRVATAPRVDAQWMNAMLASDRATSGQPPVRDVFAPGASVLSFDTSKQAEDANLEQLQMELEGNARIGKYVSQESLISIVSAWEKNSTDEQLEKEAILSIRIILSWSRRVREAMIERKVTPTEFHFQAEANEYLFLTQYLRLIPDQHLDDLKRDISSNDLRKRSRLAAIQQMWFDYHHLKIQRRVPQDRSTSIGGSIGGQSIRFAGLPLAANNPWFLIEDWRQNRLVDKATELMTQEIGSDRDFEDRETQKTLLRLLEEAYEGKSGDSFRFVHSERQWKESDLGWVFTAADAEKRIRMFEQLSETKKD